MKYFFVLGKNEALSMAELSSVLGASNLNYTAGGIALFDGGEEFEAGELIKRLGGTVKIGRVDEEFDIGSTEKIRQFICELVLKKRKIATGKFKFGISQHGSTNLNAKNSGMEIKTYLKDKGFNSRLVTSKEKNLSSVVVETNQLTQKGVEVVLFTSGKQVMVGHTLAVQPFKELSFRDYNRPARDSYSGMLPPKLAQIMINLGRSGGETESKTILDPFCGSGTVLTEAALMGYKNLIGSDSSDKAIQDSQENLEWIKDKYNLNGIEYRLENTEAGELSKTFKKESVDMIITEPYLGPQRGRIKAEKVIKELEELYSKALKQFFRILKEGGRVVMIWPVFRDGTKPMDPDTAGFKIIPALPDELKQNKGLDLTQRNTIVYSREGQRVWREIVILEK